MQGLRWARSGFGRDALLRRRHTGFSGAFLRDVGRFLECQRDGGAKFASLQKRVWDAAQPGEAKAAAALALNSFTRGIANWFGIYSGAAAAFGLPLAFIVMLLVAYVTPRSSRPAE